VTGKSGGSVVQSSFFDVSAPTRKTDCIDAIVGNPPYIRYQEFTGELRDTARKRASENGVELTQLISSWAPFVVHATSFLREGGRLAFILPAELVHATYAAPVRAFLRRAFDKVFVVAFNSFAFPDVQAEVVLLLADGKREGASGSLGLLKLESADQLENLESLLQECSLYSREVEPEKWVADFAGDAGAEYLASLATAETFVPLSKVGKAGIGFVSGANEFFVLSPSEVKARDLPRTSLRVAVIKARQLQGVQFLTDDVKRLNKADERSLLWLPGTKLDSAESAYVRHGEILNVHTAYKCRVRKPWYQVPGVVVPHAFLTYMSDVLPRLTLNRAEAVSSNTLLNVKLHGVPEDLRDAFVVAFYNSATLLSCERIGRAYGGGVLKLEPREADRVLVPSLDLIRRVGARLRALLPVLDGALRSGEAAQVVAAVSKVDEAILVAGADLSARKVKAIADSWAARTNARRSRAGKLPAVGKVMPRASRTKDQTIGT
jgi:adenine-specific DNA methylase